MNFDYAALDAPVERDWPVTISVPQDGGKAQEQKLSIRFRFVEEAELENHGDGTKGSIESVRAVVVGFGKDETQAFSAELLDKMLRRPWVRHGIMMAYRNFCLGLGETVAGN